MSVQIHLKLDGVTGESEKQGFEGQIEVLSFSNGATNHSSVAHGQGSGAGKVDVSSISIQKILDSATPTLFLKCCDGTEFSTGTLSVAMVTGDGPAQTYYWYDLTSVRIDSINWGAVQDGGKPSESVSFSAATMKLNYKPQSDTGGTLGAAKTAGWDVKSNKKV